MKDRRNIFFAKAVKNIGKNKTQIKDEKRKKLLQKRLVQVSGGFELPKMKNIKDPLKRKKLFRSGSLIRLDKPLEQLEEKKVEHLARQLSPTLRKKKFLKVGKNEGVVTKEEY